MPNLSKHNLSAKQDRFVDDIASLMTPWGMPLMSARIYGLLLLHSQATSLDQIAADLEISKSTASVSARVLENHMLVRRKSEKGSKRLLYVASENSTGLLSAKSFLLGEFGRLLETRAKEVTTGDALHRLQALGRFYLTMQEALDTLLHDVAPQEAPLARRSFTNK